MKPRPKPNAGSHLDPARYPAGYPLISTIENRRRAFLVGRQSPEAIVLHTVARRDDGVNGAGC